ncbi:AMP-binding protein [Streptomyces goshikiensis]|uniref:AMP-binding protein n=1 Tax=Streptomyces goshikiensis TaxID=1942 RepID=UPI00331D1501
MTETAHVVRAYAVTGGLDTQALRAAWRDAAAGQDTPGGGARPGGDAHWFTDLGTVADAGPWEAAERLWGDPLALSFPADRGPAARLTVARFADGGHLVLIAVNRAFAAGRSLAGLADELSAAYAAETAGRTGDFGSADFDWGTEISTSLGEMGAQEGVTPYDVLLTAYHWLLGRHGGEDGVTVAVTGGGRIRADFSGQPAFRELLRRTAAQRRSAAADRRLPLQRTAGSTAAASEEVPYDAVFASADPFGPVLRLAGTRVRRLRSDEGWFRGDAPEADIALTVHQTTPSVTGHLTYRTTPYDPSAAAGFLSQLHTVLEAALADPGTPAHALPLEAPEVIRRAVEDADAASAGVWSGPSVHERFHAVAQSAPGVLALSGATGDITYGELHAQAARITDALRGIGVGEGSAVALMLPAGSLQAAALLGVFGADAHAVCLGTGDTGERGKAVFDSLRPHCLVLAGDPGDRSGLVDWYRDELDGCLLDLDVLTDGHPYPATPDRAVPGAEATTVASAPGRPDEEAPAHRWAYVAYTSGTTGTAKGIPQTHRTFAQFIDWFTGEFGIGPGSRVAQWSAPGYDAALVEVFAALAVGATLCPVPERIRSHPEKLADWLDAQQITHFQTVPSFARELLGAIGSAPGRLGGLGHLLLAGEPLSGQLAGGLRTALPAARLVNLYGSTETILATWDEVASPVPGPAPIGRSIPGRQVLVLDENDQPCPAGVTGSIVVCGPHVTPGYIGEGPGREAFRPVAGDGLGAIADRSCHRTGDLGRRRWDGRLEFSGRGDDSRIKFSGTRLELIGIEAALAAHDSVSSCAVVAHTGPDGLVTRLEAYVVPHRSPDGEPLATSADWRAALVRWFGKALPALSFVTLDSLPRNTGGKVDRHTLAGATAR